MFEVCDLFEQLVRVGRQKVEGGADPLEDALLRHPCGVVRFVV
jgi:hypothetical protein